MLIVCYVVRKCTIWKLAGGLDDMMKMKYNNINKKLEKLKDDNKIYTQRSNHVFYQRIENMSNIEFTSDEKTLLS
jgi:hypothetical protein